MKNKPVLAGVRLPAETNEQEPVGCVVVIASKDGFGKCAALFEYMAEAEREGRDVCVIGDDCFSNGKKDEAHGEMAADVRTDFKPDTEAAS